MKVLAMKSAFHAYLPEIKELAKKHDRELVVIQPKTQEEYMAYFKDNDVDVVVNTWPEARGFGGYTPDMIRAIGKSGVRAVCHQGAGYDVVGDIEVWKNDTKVEISNCPHAPAPDTATTAVFLLIATLRNFRGFNLALQSGNWRGNLGPATSTVGTTLGILGLGNIGQMIRDRAAPFGFDHILYYQRRRLDPELEKGAEFVPDLDEFLSRCDAVVVVVPHNKSTHHLLNRKRLLEVIKPGAVVVNVGRGPVIDEDALADALDAERLSGVGLDVYEFEPEINPKLLANNRTFLLPHVGTHTMYAWKSFEREAYDNVKSVLETGHVVSLVPELQ